MAEDNEWWEIKIESKSDAARYSRIGGLAGFSYAIIGVILLFLFVLMNMDELAELTLTERYSYLVFGFIQFTIFAFLAWRIYSKYDYISAIIMFVLFVILSIISFRLSILNILLTGGLGYGMYAGIIGTFAYRRYQKKTNIDVFN